MNAKTTTTALLTAGLILSSSLTAQQFQPDTNPYDADRYVSDAADADSLGYDVAKRIDTQTLGFEIGENSLRVSNGGPGDQVGIFMGLSKVEVRLPGGAELRIDPLILVASGRLNSDGEFEVLIASQERTSPLPGTYYFQALSVNDESFTFSASNVKAVIFDSEHAMTDPNCGSEKRAMAKPDCGRAGEKRALAKPDCGRAGEKRAQSRPDSRQAGEKRNTVRQDTVDAIGPDGAMNTNNSADADTLADRGADYQKRNTVRQDTVDTTGPDGSQSDSADADSLRIPH